MSEPHYDDLGSKLETRRHNILGSDDHRERVTLGGRYLAVTKGPVFIY